MAKAKKMEQNYPELEELKHDIDSLRSHVVELTKHIRDDNSAQLKEMQKTARQRWQELRSRSAEQYENFENELREHPNRSVVIAFASGLIASFLLNNRRG